MMDRLYFVEDLNLISWLGRIFPFLAKDASMAVTKRKIHYIDGSRIGIFIARLTAPLVSACVKRLDFHIKDIKDEEGILVSERIPYRDVMEVQNEILKDPVFSKIAYDGTINKRLYGFLSKQIVVTDAFGNENIQRAMLLAQIAAWKMKAENAGGTKATFFLNERGWSKNIREYAARYGINTVFIPNMPKNSKSALLQIFGKYTTFLMNVPFWFSKHGFKCFITNSRFKPDDLSSKLCVEYYGHLNLKRPELNSDLFFFRPSGMSGKDVLLTFNLPEDPLDQKKMDELSKYGISAVALAPKKTATFYPAPIFHYKPGIPNLAKPDIPSSHSEIGWFNRQISYYHLLFDYWRKFFESNNAKVYLSWFKYNATHCVIADAMQSLGGVTAIYQRSFEEFSSPLVMVASDIVFGFSKSGFERERLSGSSIPYYVVTGYIGDYRFSLLSMYAKYLKDKLHKAGAEHILAYCDGNSTDDSRWNIGHEFIREQYSFLLEKVLSEPWFGLVLKPKAPATLRRRLGPIADILKKAEGTGRCFVFEGGNIHGSYPPAAAALAADIAIDHLAGATAALESVLAGVPTLLIDREGWKMSRLHGLKYDKVVFVDWNGVWQACRKHWKTPNGIPGFGDWSSILDEIDPFRDGKAAERIGAYLKWLIDGLKAGRSRDSVMAEAAERYCGIWGKDKIKAIGQ